MSFVSDKQYSSYTSNDMTNYSQLPFNYLETKPAQFAQNNSTPKSFWQPGSEANEKLLEQFTIRNNSDYRKYMTQNADNARSYNEKEYKAQLSK